MAPAGKQTHRVLLSAKGKCLLAEERLLVISASSAPCTAGCFCGPAAVHAGCQVLGCCLECVHSGCSGIRDPEPRARKHRVAEAMGSKGPAACNLVCLLPDLSPAQAPARLLASLRREVFSPRGKPGHLGASLLPAPFSYPLNVPILWRAGQLQAVPWPLGQSEEKRRPSPDTARWCSGRRPRSSPSRSSPSRRMGDTDGLHRACAHTRSWGGGCGHLPLLHVGWEVRRAGSPSRGDGLWAARAQDFHRGAPALSCPPEATAPSSDRLAFENAFQTVLSRCCCEKHERMYLQHTLALRACRRRNRLTISRAGWTCSEPDV